MFKKISPSLFIHISVILLCLLYTFAGIAINLNRFWQYEAGYYDFGIFDHALWQLSRFQAPIIDHFVVPGKISLADHFYPSIYLLAPIYWIWDSSEMLLIAQDVMVGLSGYVLYRIGLHILKNAFWSLSAVIAYFLFVGLQNAIFSDFHELTAATLFIMLTYWAIVKRYKKRFLLFFILTLGFKEPLFIWGVGTSIFVWFYRKEWRKLAIFTAFGSLIWGYLVIKVIIPALSGGAYGYISGTSKTFVERIQDLYTPIVKIKTVFWIFASFLFLPLLAPSLTFIVILNLVSRFLTDGSTRWDLGLHYNAEIAPTLGLATVLALLFLSKKLSRKALYVIATLVILNSLILHRFILRGPFGLAYNKAFYEHTKGFTFLDKLVEKVPQNVSVAAQNNLASRFLHQKVWILRENYRQHMPEYIVIDMRDGQNINNFLGIKDYKKLFETIKKDKDYEVFYHEGEQYVFKKK